jgi:hypothetical protein
MSRGICYLALTRNRLSANLAGRSRRLVTFRKHFQPLTKTFESLYDVLMV